MFLFTLFHPGLLDIAGLLSDSESSDTLDGTAMSSTPKERVETVVPSYRPLESHALWRDLTIKRVKIVGARAKSVPSISPIEMNHGGCIIRQGF